MIITHNLVRPLGSRFWLPMPWRRTLSNTHIPAKTTIFLLVIVSPEPLQGRFGANFASVLSLAYSGRQHRRALTQVWVHSGWTPQPLKDLSACGARIQAANQHFKILVILFSNSCSSGSFGHSDWCFSNLLVLLRAGW